MEVPIELRRDLARREVFLDGQPARIVGAQLAFARVITLDGSRSAEWAWRSVAKICAEGGWFEM